MDKIHLKSLIVEQRERFLSKKGLFTRDALAPLCDLLDRREIVVLSGVRRCGKSSLMRLACDELITRRNVATADILYLNFEDERFIDFTTQDFEKIHELFDELRGSSGTTWFFLDEIQNVKGWEKWLNRLYEFEDVRVVVTGSNASLLESDARSALTGRNRQLAVYPLSFREFLVWKGIDTTSPDAMQREDRVRIKKAFAEYLGIGGFGRDTRIQDLQSGLRISQREVDFTDLRECFGGVLQPRRHPTIAGVSADDRLDVAVEDG